ncbi:MAG TPA: hypothetical protein EYN93_04035 [Planctomycetaceae bacterium]|nr:hypothetical protein [Planctomycetaceae bacterium]
MRTTPNKINMSRWLRIPRLMLLLWCAVFGAATTAVAQQGEMKREIYVPFDDLKTVLASGIQRIYLPRSEYEALLKKANIKPGDTPPQQTLLRSAKYRINILGDAALVVGDFEVESLAAGLQQLPLGFSGVSILNVTMGENSASLVRDSDQLVRLLLPRIGKSQVQFSMSAAVQHAAAEQTLTMLLPHAANSRIELIVSGNIEIKSGASVLERTVDEAKNVTRFDLLAKPGPLRITMSLNNKRLMTEEIVVARNVLVAELTQAIQRLHGTFSMQVQQGAASDFRFAIAAGFQVTDVQAPGVSRWSVAEQDSQQVLTVEMRIPQTEDLLIKITALHSSPAIDEWEFPKIEPLDVLVSTGVVGILADRRLAINSLETEGVIALDTQILEQALPESIFVVEPGAPLIRVLGTYYVPQSDYKISAQVTHPENRIHVQTTTQLSLNQSNHTVSVSFNIFPELDDLYALTIEVPAQWNIVSLHTGNDQLIYHETIDEMGIRRLHAKFPTRRAFGQVHNVVLLAKRVPEGWLDDWDEFHLSLPKFMIEDTFRDKGVLAIRTQLGFEEVYEVRPEQVSGVVTLATADKQQAGLTGRLALAYRYEQPQFTVAVVAKRVVPVLSARVATFLNVQPGVLKTYSELTYTVQQSLVEKVQFKLPASSPADLNVVGFAGTVVKQFSSIEADEHRIWTVTLDKPTAGVAVIGVDFEQVIQESETEYSPAIATAENVVYQSGVLSVESSPELAIKVGDAANTDLGPDSRLKPVDVGELVVNGYSVGKHRVGAYGYTGTEPNVRLAISRPLLFSVPSTLIQRSEIVSFVSRHGVYQSVARFEILTKASYIQVALPEQASLWSVVIDGAETVKPQKVSGTTNRFLVSFPHSKGNVGLKRDLRVVYEQRLSVGHAGFQLKAPELFEFARVTAEQQQLPIEAGLIRWQLIVPGNFVVQPYAESNMQLIGLPRVLSQGAFASVAVLAGGGGVLLPSMGGFQSSDSVTYSIPSSAEFVGDAEFDFAGEDGAMAGERRLMENAESFADKLEAATPALTSDAPNRVINGPRDNAKEPAEGESSPVPRPPAAADPGSEMAPEDSEAPMNENANGKIDRLDGEHDEKYSYRSSQTWALQGMKSLNVDLLNKPQDANGDLDVQYMDFVRYDFQSLGGEPKLVGRIVRKSVVTLWAWIAGIAVLLVGLLLLPRDAKSKRNYVLVVLTILALAAAVPALRFYQQVLEVVFVLTLALALIYCFYHLLKPGVCWFQKRAARITGLGCGLLLATLLFSGVADAQQDDPFEEVQTVQVPADAVIVPYDPAQLPTKRTPTDQLLIPLELYSQLWRQAYPELPLEHEVLPVEYAFSSVKYESTLFEDDSIFIEGVLGIEVFSGREVAIGLALNDLVLQYATLDKLPAQIQVRGLNGGTGKQANGAQQQALNAAPQQELRGNSHTLFVKGRGHHELRVGFKLRVQRQGGWRLANGSLPIGASGLLVLHVPRKDTEVRWNGHLGTAELNTDADNQRVESPLKLNGGFNFRWRSIVSQSGADRDLIADSQLLVDVQEDGVYVDWQVRLEFRNSQLEIFRFVVPNEYRVAAVTGGNIRSWEVQRDANDRQSITVELLEPAENQATLHIGLLRYRSLPGKTGDSFSVPAVSVPDAVSQKGTITIRRSPALELFVNQARGVDRDDVNDAIAKTAQPADRVNPLGVQVLQAYRFSGTGFDLQFTAKPVTAVVSANINSLVRVSPQQISLETQVQFRIQKRPIHQVRVIVPADLAIRQVRTAALVDWSATPVESLQGPAQLITILLSHGVIGNLNVLIEGMLERKLQDMTTDVPYVATPGVTSQRGQTVLLSDPSFNIELLDVTQGESVSMATMFAWLKQSQRTMARTALRFTGKNYSARFKLVRRTPKVTCTTFSNANVSDRSIEETILLSYKIEDAGIQEVSFLLPAELKDSRIRGLYVRQIDKTTVDSDDPQSPIRVTLYLEDEILGEYSVLVENDREPGGRNRVPVPIVENAEVQQQYISLESSGDVVEEVLDSMSNVVALNRQQEQWEQLTAVIGERVLKAFVVQGDVGQAVLEFRTQSRDIVDKDEAKIRMATTSLIVDYAGTYRGKIEFLVDNQKEQFLEIQMPPLSQLWSVLVAGEPVKPVVTGVAGQIRLPLVKTNAGDLSYRVVIHYAGRMTAITQYGKLSSLPFIRTTNIHAEKLFLKLYLPKRHNWYGFGGDAEPLNHQSNSGWGMFAGRDISRYTSGELQTRQAIVVNAEVSGKLKRATKSGNDYEKIRLYNSLQTQTDLNAYLGQRDISQRNEKDLAELGEQVLDLVEDNSSDQKTDELMFDNRARLLQGFEQQSNGFSRNAVNQLGSNFDVPVVNSTAKPSGKKEADGRWFRSNDLLAPQGGEGKSGEANKRLYDLDQGGKGAKLDDLQKQSTAQPQGQIPGFDAIVPQQSQSNSSSAHAQQREQFKRYQTQQLIELEMRNGTIVDAVENIRRGRSGNEQSQANNEFSFQNDGATQSMGGGMGGMGGGGSGAGQAAQSPPGTYGLAVNGRLEGREATGLASVTGFDLDFDSAELQAEYDRFDFEYLDDKYDFSANYLGLELREAIWRVGGVLAVLISLSMLFLLVRVISKTRVVSTLVALLAMLISLPMIFGWILPIYGILLFVGSLLWILRCWFPVPVSMETTTS